MTTKLPEPAERVLSTLNPDGSRRWLRPRVSRGRFLSARRVLAYVLIAVFTLVPQIRVGGKPAILLDVVKREFTILGKTFLSTDTVLLALLVIGLTLLVFFLTSVLGRVWCGYACPQTVYMEFVYRPLERLFEGPPGRGGAAGKKRSGPRIAMKYIVYLLVSMFLAHTFLSYFVGVEALSRWILGSPFNHPVAFLVMAVTTGLMMFNFCYFREQTCIVACPYGRLQSVLLDRDSLIVSYDPSRGEPRGNMRARKGGASHTAGTGAESWGDCIDCGLCVETCPTGIDIRDGLKMECIGCAQCIDACDLVMEKARRPRGLIRYSSQARIAGEPGRILRPRVILYPAILLVVAVLFVFLLAEKKDTDVTVLRGLGAPFAKMPGGEISNAARLKITNRGSREAAYGLEVTSPISARLILDEDPIRVAPGKSVTCGLLIVVPDSIFVNGKYDLQLRITHAGGFEEDLVFRLLGPARRAVGPPARPPDRGEANGGAR